MIWLQGSASLLLWLAYGFWLWRRACALSGSTRICRSSQATKGALFLICGALMLVVGMWAVLRLGGFGSDGMTAFGWLGVSALGLVFVHMQAAAASVLIGLAESAVTKAPEGASFEQKQEAVNR